jgi:hypothetical protein
MPLRQRLSRLKLFALLTVVILLVYLGLSERQKADANASGCTLVPNSKVRNDGCDSAPGNSCYYCEYSSPGGYTACWESGTGDIKYCIDYQDIPPWPF